MASVSALQRAYPQLERAFLDKVRHHTRGKQYTAWELLALMDFETAGTFAPDQWNLAGHNYVGLIQFGAAAAQDLGTTLGELEQMSRLEQVEYVFQYLDQRARWYGPLTDIYDLYSAVLWPAGIGQPLDYVFFRQGDGKYYANDSLDYNGDGTVTKKEAGRQVARRLRGGRMGGGAILAGGGTNVLLMASVIGLAASFLTTLFSTPTA